MPLSLRKLPADSQPGAAELPPFQPGAAELPPSQYGTAGCLSPLDSIVASDHLLSVSAPWNTPFVDIFQTADRIRTIFWHN